MANPPPARRVLVSGCAGFIGSALVRRLTADGVQVIGLGPDAGLTEWNRVKNVTGFDAVVHLAARSHVPSSYQIPHTFHSDNFLTTLNMLELARLNQGRFILASSYVYGIAQYLPVDERHPVSANNPYMASKLIAEELCASYHRDFGVPVVILRTFNVFGPGQRPGFLIPTILNGLAEGRISLGDPTPRRDFTYIDDAVEAYCAAINWRDSSFEIFNIGSGISISVEKLVEMVQRLSGLTVEVEYHSHARPSDIPEILANIRKATQLLAWAPRVTLEEGIRRVLETRDQFSVGRST
jgi:nucleoside-diphosphate-sugar epimerase